MEENDLGKTWYFQPYYNQEKYDLLILQSSSYKEIIQAFDL